MNDSLTLGVGQAHELELEFRRHDYTNALIKKLSEGDRLGIVRKWLLGQAKIEIFTHVIDLDADPYLPNDWAVEEHKKGGQFEWNPRKIKFHLSPNQTGGKCIKGNNLRRELAGEPVFNANLLDYLIKPENQHLIPEEWKKDEQGKTRFIFFWGTIYRHSDGSLCVRCLCWDGGRWVWSCNWLGRDFDSHNPAVLLAS